MIFKSSKISRDGRIYRDFKKGALMNTSTPHKNFSSVLRRTLTVIVICTALLLALTSCSENGGSKELLTKEQLTENINKESSKSYNYAAEYFDLWQLPLFDMTKIKIVEKEFVERCVLTLPDTEKLAKEAALYFLETYYSQSTADGKSNPKAIDLTDKVAVTDALLYSYVYKTGDEYAYYRTASDTENYGNDMSGELCGIGVSVIKLSDGRCEVIEVFENGGAYNAGIQVGDIFTAIKGIELNPQNQSTLFDEILGDAGTTIDITVKRGDNVIPFTVTRSLIQVPTVTYKLYEADLGADKLGYIKISSFKANTDEQFIAAIDYMEENGVKGIMFDLRGNPGGYLDSVINAIDYLVPDRNKIVSYKLKGHTETVVYSKTTHALKIPTVVLCDENTASAGELFCAALRDYNDKDILTCSLVGNTTYGKGVMQSTLSLSDGSSLTLTTAYYNPPSDVNYNRDDVAPDGVIPSVFAADNPQTTGIDELYEAGVQELNLIMQIYYGTISKEILLENVKNYTGGDYRYISMYLRSWKFPLFDRIKLNAIQNIYENNVDEKIDIRAAAIDVAMTFAEDFYADTDMSDSTKMTTAIINSWLSTLNDEFVKYRDPDEYSSYMQEASSTPSLGFSYSNYTRKITKVMPGSAAERAGVLVGDILWAVEDIPFTDNYFEIQELVTDASRSTVKIELKREGLSEHIVLNIARSYKYSTTISYKVIENNLGYMEISGFRDSTSKDFSLAINHLKEQGVAGIIFDLRGNPGGELTQVVNVIEQFAKKGAPIVSIDYFNEKLKDQTIYSEKNGTLDVPCVVICNKSTASAAELFVAAIRDYAALGHISAKIVGEEHTYGKGVMQSTQALYDGAAITYTIASYSPPSGKNYDKEGIKPDYIIQGKDEQYAKAIEVLLELVSSKM